MKINKILVLVLSVIVLLAFALVTISQGPSPNSVVLGEKQDCNTNFYNESQNVWGNISKIRNTSTSCYNAANQSYYTCINGTEEYQSYEITGSILVLKNTTSCKTKSYLVNITNSGATEQKELDFSSWGACINNMENDCLVITCQSKYDGASDGQFHGCSGGTTCQKFRICGNEVKTFYKNSRQDFAENDPTFSLQKLAIKEVGE